MNAPSVCRDCGGLSFERLPGWTLRHALWRCTDASCLREVTWDTQDHRALTEAEVKHLTNWGEA